MCDPPSRWIRSLACRQGGQLTGSEHADVLSEQERSLRFLDRLACWAKKLEPSHELGGDQMLVRAGGQRLDDAARAWQ